MNKEIIYVPAGVRYLGQWKDFHLSNFPAKCILNKVIPGCGFTRYCLESPWENVILCSPRKMLLQNKYEQHSSMAYLIRNELDQDPEVDMDIANERKVIDKDDNPDKNYSTGVKSRIYNEIFDYLNSHQAQAKFLVTYDSFRILKEILEEMGIFRKFFVVIDEFQAIMQDARFKSSTEINFLYHLQNSHSAIFVSATPMLEEYLDYLKDFRDLPYYELDWKKNDLSRIVKPDLDIRKMNSIVTESRKIIDRYKSGNFESLPVIENGVPTNRYSTEAVIYVNSVAAIIRIIKANKLIDSEVNILCSNTDSNQRKLWSKLLSQKELSLPADQRPYKIGRVPLEGEPRKLITLCTRTVYLGADFYSNCAKSFIFSDPNSDYLSVDISQDLPQILGRQRCDDNPWKNSAVFFYKTTSPKKNDEGGNKRILKTKEDFDNRIKEKDNTTADLMNIWNRTPTEERDSLLSTMEGSIFYFHYSRDYISLNKEEVMDPVTGIKVFRLKPVINELVKVSEKRAFDIQQVDYADRFSVFTTISGEFNGGFIDSSQDSDPVEFQVTKFFEVYDSFNTIYDKLKLLCEINLTDRAREVVLAQLPDTDKVKYFYITAGPDCCRANSYQPKRISDSLGVKFFNKSDIAKEIYSVFKVGDNLPLSDIKEKIRDVYNRVGYNKTPKAKDIESFFNIKKTKKVVSGKSTHSYELIKKLL